MTSKPIVLYHTAQASRTRQEILRVAMDIASAEGLEGLSIGRLATDKDKTNQGPASEPEVGGVFRGAAFPWRQFARSVNFSTDRAGVLVLSSENAEKK